MVGARSGSSAGMHGLRGVGWIDVLEGSTRRAVLTTRNCIGDGGNDRCQTVISQSARTGQQRSYR
jgi:hypothetical protein